MNSRLILRELKEALKKRKITYKALAQQLGVTEAAIKKQFQASDISFNRIQMICDLMGLSFTTLLSQASLRPIQELTLNRVQEATFIKNPRLFVFFLKLSEENGDLEKANDELHLDSNTLWKNLKKLDDLGLIKLHAKNKVELIHGSLLTVSSRSPVMEAMTHQLAKDFIEAQRKSKPESKFLKISLLKLSKKNAEQLKLDLQRTYELYLRHSEIDGFSMEPGDLTIHSVLLAAGEFSFI